MLLKRNYFTRIFLYNEKIFRILIWTAIATCSYDRYKRAISCLSATIDFLISDGLLQQTTDFSSFDLEANRRQLEVRKLQEQVVLMPV